MNIQAVKLELVQKLLSVKNEQVLTKINQILEKEVIVAYTTEGKPLTKEQYNKSLLAAEKQIKAGKYITHDALINKSAKWKTKK
jgi:hypothetical protein